MSESASPRRLSHEKFFALAEWVRKNTESILQDRPSMRGLAQRAGKDLGHAIHDETMAKAVACYQLTWEPKHVTGGKAARSAAERIDALELAVAAEKVAREQICSLLAERLAAHNSMIAHMCAQLGISPAKGM